jgi:fatty acid desaturase
MSSARQLREKYTRRIAYPTIVLTLVALLSYGAAIYFAVQGSLAIGWAVLLNTVMAYLLFTSMHEAAHSNISGTSSSAKWLDEVVGWASSWTLFAPFYLFKIIHFKHHAHTNDPEKDPDHWLASKNFFSLLFHSFTVFPVYLISGLRLLLGKEPLVQKIRRELWISYAVLAALFVILGVLIAQFGAYYPLMLWVLPAFLAQALLAFAFDWLPHHPHENRERYLNTRVVDIPGISAFLLSQNFHLIHHLYPNIPFYHYKNAYKEIEETVKEKGTTVVRLR